MNNRKNQSNVAGKQILYNIAIRIVGLCVGFLTDLIFVRKLGKEAYGLFALALSMISVMGIFSISGFPNALVRIIGAYSNKSTLYISRFLKLSLMWVIGVSLASALFIVFGAEVLANDFFQESRLENLCLPTALQLFLFSLCSLWLGIFEGLQLSSIGYSIREVIARLLKILFFFIVGIWLGFNAYSLMWGFCIGQFFSLTIYMIWVGKTGGSAFKIVNILKAKIPRLKDQKKFLTFSWALASKSFIGLLMANAGRLMLAYYRNSGEIGLYSVSMNLGNLLMLGLGALNVVMLPIVARLYKEKDHIKLKALYQASFNASTMLSVPLFAIMIFYPDQLLLIYGPEFSEAKMVLVFISIAFFVNAVIGTNYPFLIMSKHYKIEIVITFLAGMINLIVGIILIPQVGILGAAFAFLAAKVTLAFLRSIWLYRAIKLNHFTKKSWRFVILVPALFVLKWVFASIGLSSLCFLLIFFCASYSISGIVYYYLVISKEEKNVIQSILKSFNFTKTNI